MSNAKTRPGRQRKKRKRRKQRITPDPINQSSTSQQLSPASSNALQRTSDQTAEIVTNQAMGNYLMLDSMESIEAALIRVLPDTDARVCASVAEYLWRLASGECHKPAAKAADLSWARLQAYKGAYPVIAEMYKLAKECGEDVRQAEREAELHRRGVIGFEEPVFHKGEEVGSITRYSDKCLELGLKANDPGKYSDKHQVEHTGTQLVYHIHGLRRDPMPDRSEIPVEPIESGVSDE